MATTASSAQIVSFPQEHYNYYNNNYYADDEVSLKHDNIARAHAHEEDWLAIEGAYFATYGRAIAPVVRTQMQAMMEQGAAPDLLAAVIEYSAAAPRPSWAYARTVIQRQMQQGTRTAAEFTAACAAYRQKAAQRARPDCWNAEQGYYSSRPKRVIEQQYPQREYSPEDGGMSAEDIAAARML